MAFLKGIFGSPEDRLIKSWEPLVDRINKLEASFEKLSPEEQCLGNVKA